MKYLYIAVTVCISTIQLTLAQNLPAEVYFSPGNTMLLTGGKPHTGLYNTEVIKSLYLNFPQTNYWTLLTNNYASETNIIASMTFDSIVYDSVGVRFRGNTSYTTIGTSQKKSFAIEMDWLRPNQDLMGYKNLKLNNAHQDPTFMREVLYSRMAARYIPIARANFVRLYINNQDWGLYPNIQNVDKTFLESWFLSNDGANFRATKQGTGAPGGGWGDGTAGMNYLSADSTPYLNYYSLKSSDIADPWNRLVKACYGLSTASTSNKDTVKKYIDIDRALWLLAVENIFTDDDSYTMKGKMDYMVYYEPETGLTMPLEYDGNSTFQTTLATSTSWGPFKNVTNVNYPLLNKLLNVPEWRQRYLAHYRTILNETFTSATIDTLVNQLNAQIFNLVLADTKKLYSNQQYNNGVPQIKSFVTSRRAYLLSNIEVAQQAPKISSAPYFNSSGVLYQAPTAMQPTTVKVTLSTLPVAQMVYLYYATGVSGATFTKLAMFNDGLHNDGAANDTVWAAEIPGFPATTLVRYYVEAVGASSIASVSYLPEGAEHDVYVYEVQSTVQSNGVVINELLASNTATQVDSAGDFDDWIELYNTNTTAVDLAGFYISDNANRRDKWKLPQGTVLPAGGYLILWADEEQTEGTNHINFKLSASGESLIFSDTVLNTVDEIIFPIQSMDTSYARIPNGTGAWAYRIPTFGRNNENAQSVSAITRSYQLKLYPNPVSETLYLKLGNNSNSPFNWHVYDLQGKEIMQGVCNNSNDFALDCSNIPTGMYVIRLQQDNVIQLARFIRK